MVNLTDLRWSSFYILFTSHHFLSRPVFALLSVTHLPLSSSVLLFIFFDTVTAETSSSISFSFQIFPT